MMITDGIKVIEVSERAYNLIYKNHGFTDVIKHIEVIPEKVIETKHKRKSSKTKFQK